MTQRSLWCWIAGTILLLLAIGYLYIMDPHQQGNYPSCPFYAGTGLYCPGCGSLRAIHCLLHGHVAEAAARNILALILLPVALYSGLLDLVKTRSLRLLGREFKLPPLPYKTPLVVLTFVLVYWVARNLPWFPFNLLAPRANS